MTPRTGRPSLALPLLLLVLAAACGEESAPTPQTGARPKEVTPAPQPAPAPEPPPRTQAPPPATGGGAPSAGANQAESGAALEPIPAKIARDTELKQKPFVDADTLARLPAGAAVTVTARRGGWYQVRQDDREGWVRLLYVSTQPEREPGADELQSAARIATGRAGSGNVASTTGIRGLTPEQLREAEPNAGELKRLDAGAVGENAVIAYARKHDLERREVAHLPEPE